MIPKNIIYAWFGESPYPDNVKEYIKEWKEKNPSFTFIKIDESNFDINFCDFTKTAYQEGKMAFVSDVARIWAVNKFGGIYLDTDVELLNSLGGGLLQYSQFWAEEDAGFVNSGLIFGSEANNPFLLEILNQYRHLSFKDVQKLKEISTVQIISKMLRKHGLRYSNNNQVLSHGEMVFGPEYFAPFHYWGGGKIDNKTIAIHHYNASWVSTKKSIINYLGHELFYHVPLLSKICNR